MKSNISFDETLQLHKQLDSFTRDRISSMKNNSNAELFQFERCELNGAYYYCPINGIMNADFYDINQQLTRLYGHGSRIVSEVRGDGEGYITRIIINTTAWKRMGGSGNGRGSSNRPSFQTLIIYFLLLNLLSAALYYKVMLA